MVVTSIMKLTIISLLLLSLIASCHSPHKMAAQSLQQIPVTIIGSFKDDYGSTYQINNKEWIQDVKIKYHLLQYSKEGNYFIAQNDKDNRTAPGLYTRIDIMYFEKMEPWKWGYCLTAYKAATIEDAIKTAAADRSNPRKGCNGFPFSRMQAMQ